MKYLETPAGIPVFKDRGANLKYALSQRPQGVCCEFGVFKGDTTRLIGKAIDPEIIWAFDSFKGLPERWDFGSRIHQPGHFNLDGIPPKLTDNTQPVVGWIEETLPGWIERKKNLKVGFVHIDVDLYAPTKAILNLLKPHFTPGAVIVFDELADFNKKQVYTNWRDGEYKALMEEIPEFKIISRTSLYQVAIKL